MSFFCIIFSYVCVHCVLLLAFMCTPSTEFAFHTRSSCCCPFYFCIKCLFMCVRSLYAYVCCAHTKSWLIKISVCWLLATFPWVVQSRLFYVCFFSCHICIIIFVIYMCIENCGTSSCIYRCIKEFVLFRILHTAENAICLGAFLLLYICTSICALQQKVIYNWCSETMKIIIKFLINIIYRSN